MSNCEIRFNENQICKAIALFYKMYFNRNVSVKISKKKKRANVTSKYEPCIEFMIVDVVDFLEIETYSAAILDSSIIKTILTAFLANKGFLVKDVNVNANIDRKIRKKDNVVFENVKVSYDAYPDKNDLESVINLDKADVFKLNTSTVILNSFEIFDLIKEYFKKIEYRCVDVKYIPRKVNENYNFFEEEKIILDGDEYDYHSFKDNDDERVQNHCLAITEYNNIEYITEEDLKAMLSKVLRAHGYLLNSIELYDLNSYFLNRVENDYDYEDHTADQLKLYVNFTNICGVKAYEDSFEYADLKQYLPEKPKKLSFGSRIKNMVSSIRNKG